MSNPIKPTSFQVSPLGSADPEWQKHVSAGVPPQPTTMNPIMEKFAGLSNDKSLYTKLQTNPVLQVRLFDADNAVKSNAGITRMKGEGAQDFGIDLDGQPIYAIPAYLQESKNFRIGEGQMTAYGQALDSVGAFRSQKEAESFAHYTKTAGSPKFQGEISAHVQQGNHKEAVNAILTKFGKPGLDDLGDDHSNIATAFAAHNLVGNWDKMNPTQRSMAMSAIGMSGYRDEDGKPITDRVLIEGGPGTPGLNVKTAMGLTAAGTNVPALMKNWDQVNAIQQITYGKGSPSQMAVLSRQFGFTGDAKNGSRALDVSPQQLGSLGFKASPSVGVGAITGPSANLPQGYTVVAAGNQEGHVIAVPQGHEGTVATMNGTAGVTSLNVGTGNFAGEGAVNVYRRWGPSPAPKPNGVAGGSSMLQGINNIAQNNPYAMSAIVAASAHGNTLGLRAQQQQAEPISKEDLARASRQAVENAVVSAGTGIPIGTIQGAADKATGGLASKARNVADSYDPTKIVADKVLAKGFGMLEGGGPFGGGNKEHASRNLVRKGMVNAGLFDKDYNVTLADGTKFYAGQDGSEGRHEFRNPGLAVEGGGKGRSLSAYDVDYTNDLDYSANLMTLSLMRIVGGGKGTPIDQVAGQMANAALSPVGYGQDNTPENFSKVQANARAFYAQAGIKSKEDAYALTNQAFAEHRISEMDLVQMQQGINLAFDENGHESAQMLLSWKDKGIQVASQIPNAPGPIYDFSKIPAGQFLPWQFPETPDYGPGESGPIYDFSKIPPGQFLPWHFPGPMNNGQYIEGAGPPGSTAENPYGIQFASGTYWGPSTQGTFASALQNYTDPAEETQEEGFFPRAGANTKEDMRARNAMRY